MDSMLTESKNNQSISQPAAACIINIFIIIDGISRLFFARLFPSCNSFFILKNEYFTNNHN